MNKSVHEALEEIKVLDPVAYDAFETLIIQYRVSLAAKKVIAAKGTDTEHPVDPPHHP